ncbi:MAG TPA: hypothetical protein VGK20_02090 [Candidatus Binatia bacterium]|jgi:hypothetical protein
MISVRDAEEQRSWWNRCRFRSGETGGHYESWFLRANHPDRPLAFWIRYTIFCPRGRPDDAVGELWAIFFDKERARTTAVKEVVPLAACSFSTEGLDVRIAGATLDTRRADGSAASHGHQVRWSLDHGDAMAPLLLLPREAYERGLPRAKALVGSPNARLDGSLVVDGEVIDVDGWRGSQNHNWGSRHTDSYAWGQVAGFDDAPDVFLECATAQVRVGPVWTPRLSFVVVRAGGLEIARRRFVTALRARGEWSFFEWKLRSSGPSGSIDVAIRAPREAFAGLAYANPPGGTKTCLNTKLAACTLSVEQPGQPRRTWVTANRAAFEILTDRTDHGVAILV